MTFDQKLDPNTGPKRILALDGGGIRGALSLGYLEKLEQVLKARHPHIENFRLHHYFDLIGGTSTGSIIAAALSIGMSVAEIKDKYFVLGEKIFGEKNNWWNIFEFGKVMKANFSAEPLEKELKNLFGDYTLGDREHIKTGLCIVAKRADTNSVWPLINHPGGKYFNSTVGANSNILLRNAIRASAAAPTYFLPISVDVGQGIIGAFVDGGVSMANNPALELLKVATLKGFPFHWETGEDKLLLISIGTGMSKLEKLPKDIEKNHQLKWAQQIPDMLMQDASWSNQTILQWLSRSPTAKIIDGEIGSLNDDLLTPQPLLHYLRYNVTVSAAELEKVTGQKYSPEHVEKLTDMSNAKNCSELYSIGLAAGQKEILESHIPVVFDLK
ncbi:MAG: patatin-like phospholipase family protein [Bacteroidetes bacterium]|nr:patatin-like phospholipase family protein [Bacteroidota bacterium]